MARARASGPADPVLGPVGAACWAAVTAAGYVLRPDERVTLEQACRLLDLAAKLQAAVDEQGVTVPGSQGQPRAHPALSELRGARAEASRMLARLKLPDPVSGEAGSTLRSEQARKAARARWDGPASQQRRGGRRGRSEGA